MSRKKKVTDINRIPAGVPDYNMEDTGRLMTMSSRGSRIRKIALIAAAVLLVAAIAAAGFILIGDKRYDDQLAIADKAFAEGNYELAEAEYLKAVSISKRKPKAREGLAYTYAVQGKKQESIEAYTELKKDFGDQKYDNAIRLVEEDLLPEDRDLIPAIGLWRNSSPDSLPYGEDLKSYLWDIHFDYFGVDGTSTFDCNKPAGFPALSLLMRDPYILGLSIEYRLSESYDIWHPDWMTDWMDENDPRGWVRQYDDMGGYYSADKVKADEMVKAIFNVSDDIIAEDLKRGEAEKDLYEEGGRYYKIEFGGGGAADFVFDIGDTWTDGQKYCFKYDAGWMDYEYDDERIDPEEDHCTYYIILEPKLIGGEHYWSLYYLGTEMPKDVADGLTNTYGDGGKSDSGKTDGGKTDGAAAYQPVIDEYKQVLAEAANGKEYDIFGSGNPNGFTYVFAELIPHELNGYRTPLYAIKDINGDGVAEMIIGAQNDDQYYVGSILTLDGSGAPVGIIDCGSFMYRADLDVYADGTIMYGGSSGADSNEFEFYKLEGTGLSAVDTFRMDGGKGTHNGESMSEEKYFDAVDQARARDQMKFDWKSF